MVPRAQFFCSSYFFSLNEMLETYQKAQLWTTLCKTCAYFYRFLSSRYLYIVNIFPFWKVYGILFLLSRDYTCVSKTDYLAEMWFTYTERHCFFIFLRVPFLCKYKTNCWCMLLLIFLTNQGCVCSMPRVSSILSVNIFVFLLTTVIKPQPGFTWWRFSSFSCSTFPVVTWWAVSYLV